MALIGTCSLCSGPVTTPDVWTGCYPPPKTCQFCFAIAKETYGPVVPMMHRPNPYARSYTYPWITFGNSTSAVDVTCGQTSFAVDQQLALIGGIKQE